MYLKVTFTLFSPSFSENWYLFVSTFAISAPLTVTFSVSYPLFGEVVTTIVSPTFPSLLLTIKEPLEVVSEVTYPVF